MHHKLDRTFSFEVVLLSHRRLFKDWTTYLWIRVTAPQFFSAQSPRHPYAFNTPDKKARRGLQEGSFDKEVILSARNFNSRISSYRVASFVGLHSN
jgi:hypothetical protein